MRRPLLAVPALALAVVAGCGSSSTKAAAPATPAVTSAPAGSEAPATDSAAPMPSMSMPMNAAPTSAADASAAFPVVHIKDFSFSAPSKQITAGEMFEVVNDDSVAHTYEDVKGAFDSGAIKGGSSKMVKAPAAGTYQVKCDFHPSMHGTLVVTS